MKKTLALLPLLSYMISCAGLTANQGEDRISLLERRIEAMEDKITKIEEDIYKTNVRIDNISRNITDLRVEVEKLKLPSTGKIETVEEEEEEYEEDYRKAYNRAFKLYNLKRLNQAVEAFTNFIDNFPDNDLTDNAYFWKGRAYFELGNTEKAKEEFKKLIEMCEKGRLPNCNKAPSAYLMLVRIYRMEGNEEEANKALKELREKYPTSEEAQNIIK